LNRVERFGRWEVFMDCVLDDGIIGIWVCRVRVLTGLSFGVRDWVLTQSGRLLRKESKRTSSHRSYCGVEN
jgi:hypothetical protein